MKLVNGRRRGDLREEGAVDYVSGGPGRLVEQRQSGQLPVREPQQQPPRQPQRQQRFSCGQNDPRPEFPAPRSGEARGESPDRFLAKQAEYQTVAGRPVALPGERRPAARWFAHADGLVNQPSVSIAIPLSHPEGKSRMRRIGNLWRQITSFENLLLAARRAMRGKRTNSAVAEFDFYLEPLAIALQDELQSGSYRPGPYHAFWIRDPKPRLISAAPFRDRVVHHALCAVVEPLLDRGFIFDSYANRLDKGTHRAVDRAQQFCRRYKYVLKCDVAKFFPSIDHVILMSLLERKLKCRTTLDLLRTILAASNPQEPVRQLFPGDDLFTATERRVGLPIGNLTSQFLANVMLDPLDHHIKEKLCLAGYVRFADDFLVFGDDKRRLHELLAELRLFLADFRLKLQPRKCVVQRTSDGVGFLGWRVFPTHRLLRRATGVRFQRQLRVLSAEFANGSLKWEEINPVLASWIGHLQHGDTWGLRKKLFSDAPFLRRREDQ